MSQFQNAPGPSNEEFASLAEHFASMFVSGAKNVSWNDYSGFISKTDLGVDNASNYTWIVFGTTWEDSIRICAVASGGITLRSWTKTTPSAEGVSLRNSGVLEVIWLGIKAGYGAFG